MIQLYGTAFAYPNVAPSPSLIFAKQRRKPICVSFLTDGIYASKRSKLFFKLLFQTVNKIQIELYFQPTITAAP